MKLRKVVEVTDTPVRATNGRPLIRRVEKILMPNGGYRYPVTYIDMTPGYVDTTDFWKGQKRAPGYELQIEPRPSDGHHTPLPHLHNIREQP